MFSAAVLTPVVVQPWTSLMLTACVSAPRNTRLIQVLGRSIDSRVLGRALARVIAHELYHIVAGTADHQDSGVAKAVFSAQDLTDIRFEFDSASISRMQLSPLAGFSDISAITER